MALSPELLLAGQSGIVFDDVQVRRVDWPAPATPTWQVYRGRFALGSGDASLSPATGDYLNLAVREGTWGKDYDIEAHLEGFGAGVAWHVQDKLNYYYLMQIESPSGYGLWVVRISEGRFEIVTSGGYPTSDATQPRHLHVKASGDDLGIGVYLEGDWRYLVDPAIVGEGLGVLAGSAGGAVGLTCDPVVSATCSLLRRDSRSSPIARACRAVGRHDGHAEDQR